MRPRCPLRSPCGRIMRFSLSAERQCSRPAAAPVAQELAALPAERRPPQLPNTPPGASHPSAGLPHVDDCSALPRLSLLCIGLGVGPSVAVPLFCLLDLIYLQRRDELKCKFILKIQRFPVNARRPRGV